MESQQTPTNTTSPPSDDTQPANPQPNTPNPQTSQQRMAAGQIYPSVNPSEHEQPQNPTDSNSYIGLTGSSMQQLKAPLPKGVYVIVAWNLLGVVLDFLNTSQTGLLATFILLGNLLLSIGLLLRMEIVRKILVGLYALTITVAIVNIVLLISLQNRIDTLEVQHQATTARFRGSSATPEQKKNIAALDKVLAENKEKANGAFLAGYIRQGVTGLISVVIMTYLIRPKVKKSFEATSNVT